MPEGTSPTEVSPGGSAAGSAGAAAPRDESTARDESTPRDESTLPTPLSKRMLAFMVGSSVLSVAVAVGVVLWLGIGARSGLMGWLIALVALSMVVPIAAVYAHVRHPDRAGAVMAWTETRRGRVTLMLSALPLVVLFLMLFLPGRTLGATLLQSGTMIFIFVGAGLVGSWRSRVGREWRCAKCEYERGGESLTRDPFNDRCPECGHYWRRRSGVVQGQRRRSYATLALGVLLMVTPALWTVARAQWPALGTRARSLLPTALLIDVVTSPRAGFVDDEWAALNARTLTPEERDALARGLLDTRLKDGSIGQEGDNWFVARIGAGDLAPELVDRYFGESVGVEIITPEAVRAGEAFEAGLRVRDRSAFTPLALPMSPHVAFEGWYVNDDPAPVARLGDAADAGRIGQESWFLERNRDWTVPTQADPRATVTPATGTPVRLRAAYWVLVAPAGGATAITWSEGPDGVATPSALPGELWRRRFVVERVITPRAR